MDHLLDEVVERVVSRVVERLLPQLVQPAVEEWRLFDVETVGRMLGRSKRWVHEAIKTRGLPYVRLDGGALAFELDAVKAWARARRVPALEPQPLAPCLQVVGKPAARAASNGRSLSVKQEAGG